MMTNRRNTRVLHVINSLETGGAEKLIADSIPLYQQEGLEVDVLCLKDSKTLFWETLQKRSSGRIVGLTSKSVYNPLLIFKIIPYLKKYDLIHVHLFPSLYWVVLANWLSFSNAKIIYTEHSTSNRRRKYVYRTLDRLIYNGVAKIITIADKVDANIKSHLKFPDYKFHLIHNGVDIEKYVNARPLHKNIFFSHPDFFLIQVSSFRYPKDQETLIRSLKYLPNDIKLLLVGDGPLKRNCEVLMIELNLQNRIKFLGVRTDVPELLKTADVIILSSMYEGLSLSSIEGMASGPFLASDVPGLQEIVKGYGLLFKLGNPEELADQVLKLYNDKQFFDQVGRACSERAEKFDIHKMVAKYIEVYENL